MFHHGVTFQKRYSVACRFLLRNYSLSKMAATLFGTIVLEIHKSRLFNYDVVHSIMPTYFDLLPLELLIDIYNHLVAGGRWRDVENFVTVVPQLYFYKVYREYSGWVGPQPRLFNKLIMS